MAENYLYDWQIKNFCFASLLIMEKMENYGTVHMIVEDKFNFWNNAAKN